MGNRVETGKISTRILYVSGDLSLAVLKEKAKKHNATLNDWFMACTAAAVKDYYENHSDGKKLP